MACGCGRSPHSCRGWHALTEEEYQIELEAYNRQKDGDLKVIEVEHYTDSLFRFQLTKPDDYQFIAGQFTMLSVEDAPKRAYSITSAPQDDFLEFFSIKVPNGPLTSKLQKIQVGDFVNVSNRATGTLITDNLLDGEELWLLATGTGIAPFISILSDPTTYEKYENITVVWSVREKEELNAYHSFLEEMDDNFEIDYIPIVTRDDSWEGTRARITTLIEEDVILDEAHPATDRIMVCGNIEFNKEVKEMLEAKGFEEASNRKKGSFVLERAFVG
jgi:ferredoxin/flavodoxin---NADP+ reductase